MITELMPVKYTKEEAAVIRYDTGFTEWENLDSYYKGRTLRNKVVCKFDAMLLLTDFFTQDIIKEYRDVFIAVAKGTITDPEFFSKVIKATIKADPVFANKITDLYYSCPEDVSFGSYIIMSLANRLSNIEADYRSFFRGSPEVVICMSNGYLYYSFEDSVEGPLLPDKVDCEVLSYAKNWTGNFRYYS